MQLGMGGIDNNTEVIKYETKKVWFMDKIYKAFGCTLIKLKITT